MTPLQNLEKAENDYDAFLDNLNKFRTTVARMQIQLEQQEEAAKKINKMLVETRIEMERG